MKLNVYIIHVLPLEKDDPGYDPDFLEWEAYIGEHYICENRYQWQVLYETAFTLCRVFEEVPEVYHPGLLSKGENLTVSDLREHFTDQVEFIEREID